MQDETEDAAALRRAELAAKLPANASAGLSRNLLYTLVKHDPSISYRTQQKMQSSRASC
jgi:hypothetical protein